MGSPAQVRASVKYNQKRDSIMVRTDKATGKVIRDAASAREMSVKDFVVAAVMEKIERERGADPTETRPATECADVQRQEDHRFLDAETDD